MKLQHLGKSTFAVLAVCLALPAMRAGHAEARHRPARQLGHVVSEVGQRAGIFKKHGLVLEILWTQGSGETQQAGDLRQLSTSASPSASWALSAFSKGAPVRIIGAQTTGARDLFWYVREDSPIKSLKDTAGKTIAYSTKGSSTNGIVTAFMKQYDLKATPVATGRPVVDAHAGHVGPGRRRLVGAAVRARPARREEDPHHRERQRRRRVQGPDSAPADRQCARRCNRRRRSSIAT
jgi:ABC-type nitrate/sulfonate/bicarbonate transport system substrate-binding protein